MNFYGEIVFEIADDKQVEVDFGGKILPTKVVAKGDVVTLGRKAPKNRWLYKVKYDQEGKYLETLDMFVTRLCNQNEYINRLTKIYEEVSVNIYIRSDFAEIGFSIPSSILKKMSLLDCTVNFEILSYGMAVNDELM